MKNFLIFILLLLLIGVSSFTRTDAQMRPRGDAGDCQDGQFLAYSSTTRTFYCADAPGGVDIPSGSILIILSGTCPAGFSEVSELNGKTLLGTLAGNSNIGTSGGADSITPQGSISQPTFTGDAFTAVINHTHSVSVTDPGHSHVETNNSANTGGLVGFAARDTSTNTQAATDYSTQSSTTGITASTSNPAGGVPSITPTGTVSQPTFTGTQFDNRPAFIRCIFCKKD